MKEKKLAALLVMILTIGVTAFTLVSQSDDSPLSGERDPTHVAFALGTSNDSEESIFGSADRGDANADAFSAARSRPETDAQDLQSAKASLELSSSSGANTELKSSVNSGSAGNTDPDNSENNTDYSSNPEPDSAATSADSEGSSTSSELVEGGAAAAAAPTSEPLNPEEDTLKVLASRAWSPRRFAGRFTNRGDQAPEAIFTELSGKILHRTERVGIANTTVILHSFFPEANVQGSPVTPVVTELTTNAKGEFAGTVPLPKYAASDYPGLSVSVVTLTPAPTDNPEAGQRVEHLLTGQAVSALKAGAKTSLGIFRAPGHVSNLVTDVGSAKDASVYVTGSINPARWTGSDLDQALNFFPKFSQHAPTGMLQRAVRAEPDRFRPYLALAAGGRIIATSRSQRIKRNQAEQLLGGTATTVVSKSPINNREYWLFADLNAPATGALTGQVLDAEGFGVDYAVVKAVGSSSEKTVTTLAGGFFQIESLPENLRSVQAWHADWVAIDMSGAVALDQSSLVLSLKTRRPAWDFVVKDAVTLAPIQSARFNFDFQQLRGDGSGRYRSRSDELELFSEFGEYRLDWEWAITKLDIEAVGYAGQPIKLPLSAALTEVRLQPTISLEIAPNAYTGTIERAHSNGGKTYWRHAESGSDDMICNWSYIPINYPFNVVPENVNPEEFKAREFELVLGVKNQGIVDNVYRFDVEVFVDGKSRGRVHIPADNTNDRFGTISLGSLKGAHTLRLVWRNDRWIPNQLDANIRVTSVKIFERPAK